MEARAELSYLALILSPSLQFIHREPLYGLSKALNEGSLFELAQCSSL